MIYTIKNDRLTAQIDSLGAQLISLASRELEYIWQGDIWKEHAPVLFPACGRIVNNTYTYRGKEYTMGKHGFAFKSEFELLEHSENRLVLVLEDNADTYESYPFEFKLIAEFLLEGSVLKANFTVYNDDEKAMPFMFGWHPGFTLWGEEPIESFTLDFGETDGLTQHLCTETKYISGAVAAYPLKDGIYTLSEEEIYSQDTLIFSDTEGKVTMRSPESERSIEVTWSDNLPYLAIWKWPKTEARYLCIEPWSGLPGDGVTPEDLEKRLNITLASGDSETFEYTVKCK
ncbi:MAG: aldose 1-epimerase family protein [Clostridia bacterium]|nr:aldose 1-epimerase family protein [Clostridia bacterium]